MNQEIVNVIAAYLEESDWTWRLPHNYTKDKIAQEIAAKIEPLLPKAVGWEDAPPWAKWRARDMYGAVNYFEEEPIQGEEEWHGGKYEQCSEIPFWTNTLERRPNDQTPSPIR